MNSSVRFNTSIIRMYMYICMGNLCLLDMQSYDYNDNIRKTKEAV